MKKVTLEYMDRVIGYLWFCVNDNESSPDYCDECLDCDEPKKETTMIEWTQQELDWIKESSKRMQIGDPLDELNQRARGYVSRGMQPTAAQKQALQDFQSLDLKGIKAVKGWKVTDWASNTEPAFTRSAK